MRTDIIKADTVPNPFKHPKITSTPLSLPRQPHTIPPHPESRPGQGGGREGWRERGMEGEREGWGREGRPRAFFKKKKKEK